MFLRTISFTLLTVFGISLVIFPSLEATHEILHYFKSSIHSHEHSHHHTIADHHVHSHDLPDADDIDVNGLNYVSLLFVFFHPLDTDQHPGLLPQKGFSAVISFYQSLKFPPPSTPPLA